MSRGAPIGNSVPLRDFQAINISPRTPVGGSIKSQSHIPSAPLVSCASFSMSWSISQFLCRYETGRATNISQTLLSIRSGSAVLCDKQRNLLYTAFRCTSDVLCFRLTVVLILCVHKLMGQHIDRNNTHLDPLLR